MTRDGRGCTLLAIAAQHDHYELAQVLLTRWKTIDEDNPFLEPGEVSLEAKTFKSVVDARDSKGIVDLTAGGVKDGAHIDPSASAGWTPCAIACFHQSKRTMRLLLEHGADPSIKNQYHKSAIDLAQDDLDAAGNVYGESKYEMRDLLAEFNVTALSASKTPDDPLPEEGTAIMMNIEFHEDQKAQDDSKKKGGSKKGSGKKKKKNASK